MDLVTRLAVPISLQPVPTLLAGNRYVAVTFDDGFEDNLTNAIPELQARNIPASIFVTTAYVGRTADWWPAQSPERQLRIAATDHWKRIPRDLISIGSHSITHPHLTRVSDAQAKHELCESRVMLQTLLGHDITIFSFPFGEYSDQLIQWCHEAGYERVFTIIPSNAFLDPKESTTGRVQASPTDWPIEFRLKVSGAYRWLPYAMSWKRRLAGIWNRTTARGLAQPPLTSCRRQPD